jgi:hypothetical protein
MRTLDKTEVSTIQGVAWGETLVVFLTACVRDARSRSRRAWPSASSLTGGGRGDCMGSVSGDCVGSVCGDRMGRFCGDRMGSVCGDCMGRFCSDRMGSVCGDHMERFCGDRMGSVSGDRVGCLICYTETRSTR